MDKVQQVTLLGATGSIGQSTLEVLRLNQDRFALHAVAAHSNHQKIFNIIVDFGPKRVALFDESSAAKLREMLKEQMGHVSPLARERLSQVEVLSGEQGVVEIAGDGHAQIVVGAIVGAAGLLPLMAALKTGAKICLANKEALVMSGQLFFDEAKKYKAQILPVDSEHSAIFQCLTPQLQQQIGACDLDGAGIDHILLTGSGGPFRDTPLEDLSGVTAAMAINHPVWSMGPKISVDSATMMNKALEFIEARYLFNASFDKVKVVIHPQSVVHSMVSYEDGAVLAQLGQPDMRTPIALAMSYPDRIKAGVKPLDFTKLANLTFREVDLKRYPCLRLGMEASKAGQGATTALNAANEVAVAAFLDGKIVFTDIARVVEHVLSCSEIGRAYSLEEIMAIDSMARKLAQEWIE